MKFTVFITCAFIFLFSRCRKEDALPDPNSFYFRCKVDGRDFRPDNCSNCITSTILGDSVLIFGANSGLETIGVGIRDLSGLTVKSYPLNGDLKNRGDFKNSTIVSDRYYTDSINTGFFQINKIDKQNMIIEGIFSFTAFNSNRNTTVHISEGIFNLKYSTY